ncbi:MAG: tetratricopeptide repeat protein [Pseudohongiellaceae bacterium]
MYCRRPCRYPTLVLLAVALAGCGLIGIDTGFQEDPELEARVLGKGVIVPGIDLLALTPGMRDYLSEHVPEHASDWEKVQRLQVLLFDEEYLNIQYRDDATLSAAETFEAGYANCLALINLYIAMARHVGLDVQYQTARIRPRWNRRGELVVLSEHVNALGELGGGRQYVMDFTPSVLLQPGSAHVIPDYSAQAMYFNNLGVEALIDGDAETALQRFRYALAVDPELSMVWNNIGSALNRLDSPRLAEYSYKKAFDLNRGSTTAINNLARHYSQRGDTELAATYRDALDRVNRANPYYHYVRGSVALEQEFYDEARRHFRQAIRRKDDEPDFYYALGMTLEELGQAQEAEELKTLALALHEYGDQRYRPGNQRVRRIDNRSILRSSSPGFTIQVAD